MQRNTMPIYTLRIKPGDIEKRRIKRANNGYLCNLLLFAIVLSSIIWISLMSFYQPILYNTDRVLLERSMDGEYLIKIDGRWNDPFMAEKMIEKNLAAETTVSSIHLARNRSTKNATEILIEKEGFICPENFTASNVSQFHICGDMSRTLYYKLVFFTTMYYSGETESFFYNTLRVISTLQHLDVKSVLFIENPASYVRNNRTHFVQTACDLGWTVLLVPHCNEYGFPVFRNMFNFTMSILNAEWYGYSNGDMLFDDTLVSTIDFIQSHANVLQIPLLMGRRYNIDLTLQDNISHYSELKHLHFTSRLDKPTAVDYFITHKNSFPWQLVPDFVIGRPVFDTWMVWFSQHEKLPVVDTTATVRALHQNQAGLSFKENTHKTRRVNDGMDYNKNLALAVAKRDKKMSLNLREGYISCLPLKLSKMKRSDLKYMIAYGKTKIIGRGKIDYPAPNDDMELKNLIQKNINKTRLSHRNNTEQNMKNESIETEATTMRKLLSVDADIQSNGANYSLNHGRVPLITVSLNTSRSITIETVNKTEVTQIIKSVNLPSDHDSEIKTNASSGNGSHTTFMQPSQTLTIKKNATVKSKSEKSPPVTSKPKKSRAIYINDFIQPKMIPFIGQSEEYVFVLLRRTQYLIKHKNKPGFRYVPHNQKCYTHDNIDMEMSELVTF